MTPPSPTPSALTPKQKAELEKKIRYSIPNGDARKHEWYPFRRAEIICINCALVCPENIDPIRRSRKCHTGRPLTLQDILIALAGDSQNYFVQWNNEFHIKRHDRVLCAVYDLTNNYYNQSEAFYSFLYSLLFP